MDDNSGREIQMIVGCVHLFVSLTVFKRVRHFIATLVRRVNQERRASSKSSTKSGQ